MDDSYIGTHDNETMEGWWTDSAGKQDKDYVKEYLGLDEVTDISWTMLREALKSVSRTSIVMMQVTFFMLTPPPSPSPVCFPPCILALPCLWLPPSLPFSSPTIYGIDLCLPSSSLHLGSASRSQLQSLAPACL